MSIIRSDIYVTYGIGLMALARFEAADQQFHEALTLEPDHIPAHTELARLYLFQGRVSAARRHLDRVLAQDPDHVEALSMYAQSLLIAHQDEQAYTYYKAAADREPEKAGLTAAALERLQQPDRQTDRKALQWILQDRFFTRRTYNRPCWRGEPLDGQTLLVYTEGGFGDTLQLIRYLPLVPKLAQGRVILECQQELAGLLARSMGADEVIPRDIRVSAPARPFDLEIGIMDLPLLFAARGVELPRQVPYLNVDPFRSERWKARMSDTSGWRVGLRWAGNPGYPDDAKRSCHLSDFAPLAEVAGVTFFSLQKGNREEEVDLLPQGMTLVDFSDEIEDFQDTAAIISRLDLILSTDTGVCHLAGALGAPTWLLLDNAPNHRWHTQGDSSVWYPGMRLFRQSFSGDWKGVLERVATALGRYFTSENAHLSERD